MALAAVTVAGQCRERSPADLALFGDGADRFVGRFATAAEGERLLAEVLRDGMAEGAVALRVQSGIVQGRVSLWRQRGGDRIRLVAAFVVDTPQRPHRRPAERVEIAGPDAALATERLARELRAPLRAILAFATQIRRGAPGEAPEGTRGQASDILAAAWRALRLAEEIGRLFATRPPGATPRLSEVDLLRLVQRVVRQARPVAEERGLRLHVVCRPDGAAPALVVADESALWSALETLLDLAMAQCVAEGDVRLSLDLADIAAGVELTLSCETEMPEESAEPALRTAGELVRSAGGRFRADLGGDGVLSACIGFPPERCLSEP